MCSTKVDFDTLSYKQLRAFAKQYQIPLYYRMNRPRLQEMLEIEVNGAIENENIKDIIEPNISSDRNTYFRQQQNIDYSALDEPFEYLDDYKLNPTTIPGEPSYENENFNDFNARIEHYFWVQEGEHDSTPWRCLVKLHDGRYAFYEAGCDYTGFDCQGYMRIWVSKSYATLINLAMDSATYLEYINNTENLTS
jgi:hypothetical protein